MVLRARAEGTRGAPLLKGHRELPFLETTEWKAKGHGIILLSSRQSS